MNGSGHAFQFTPMGIIPMGQAAPQLGDAVMGGTARVEGPPPEVVRPTYGAPLAKTGKAAEKFDATKPLTGKQLVQMARSRMREIDKQLSKVDGLREERSSLASLVAAATTRKTDA